MSGIIELKECYVFNSEFGDEHDNEMGKIFYYYPRDTDENTQLKRVGLCEAIVKFTRNFESEAPCDSLHTQKARFVFIQPEPDFWFVLVLSIPTVIRISPEGQEVIDYHNDQVQDNVFQAVLFRLYQKFILFNDKLSTIVADKGQAELRTRLRYFIDTHLRSIDMNQCGISDMFQGIQFLPLNRSVFLKVQCFINQLLMSLPQIRHVLLLQGEKLIWSGVGHGDIQVFYDYLVHDLLSDHIRSAESDRHKTQSFGFIFKRMSSIYLGDYSILPPSPNNNSPSSHENEQQDARSTYSNGGVSIDSFQTAASSAFRDERRPLPLSVTGRNVPKKKFHMLVYKSDQSYLTVLLDDNEDLGLQLIGQIELFLSVNFTPLAQMLTRDRASSHIVGPNTGPNSNSSMSGLVNQFGTTSLDAVSPNIKFVYFNNLNLAEKMSPGCMCDQDSYRLLADLKSDLSRMSENGEIVVKMVTDTWMVAKTSNRREFYAIFNQKGSNLLEIDEELKKLTDTHLSNIFFQD